MRRPIFVWCRGAAETPCVETVYLPTKVAEVIRTIIAPPFERAFFVPSWSFFEAAGESPLQAFDVLQMSPADFATKDKEDIMNSVHAMAALSDMICHMADDGGNFLAHAASASPIVIVPAPDDEYISTVVVYDSDFTRKKATKAAALVERDENYGAAGIWSLSSEDAKELLQACSEFTLFYHKEYITKLADFITSTIALATTPATLLAAGNAANKKQKTDTI